MPQRREPSDGSKWPAAQRWHALAPRRAAERPRSHAAHAAAAVPADAPKRPAAHSTQCVALVTSPPSPRRPGAHGWQLPAVPRSSLKEPAGQTAQCAALLRGIGARPYVPGGQALHAAAPRAA
jgi:hypothetical protein